MDGEIGEELREDKERLRDPFWRSESLWWLWGMAVGGCLMVILVSQ